MSEARLEPARRASADLPRLGFLGVGWIGRNRMEAVIETGAAEIAGISDTSSDMAGAAGELAPGAELVGSLDDLLALGLDGVVIATPSALHAEQSIRALEAGVAVFCQKPLGRTAGEAERVLAAARAADRLLGVDFSYRFTEGMRAIKGLVEAGELGHVYAVDLVFHNAYGPDKPWFYDVAQSGGGCVIDLGVHLVDLALWSLGFPEVEDVSGKLFAGGAPLGPAPDRVEDYALATLGLSSGAAVQLACSWGVQAGCDAMISAAFYGTEGGAALRNVGGSFYDFIAERYRGTVAETLVKPPDAWGGRAAADWAQRLSRGEGFAEDAERLVDVARVLDRIYGR